MSDHYAIYCTWGKRKPSQDYMHKYKISRNLRRLNLPGFYEDIAKLTWEDVLNESEVEKAYDIFERNFIEILNKHAPLKKKRVKNKESPWINDNILQIIRERNKQKQKAKETNLDADWKLYRKLRNRVTSQIRVAKKNYISNSIESCKGKSGDVWKSLQYVLPKKNKSCAVTQIKHEGNDVSDKKEIAELFNSHFVSIGKKIQGNIQISSDKDCNKQTPPSTNTNLFHFSETCESEVLDIIKSLQVKKASGLDNIPVSIVQQTASYIVKPLVHIINLSLTKGTVPVQCKLSRVTPIFKGGDKLDLGNYRPISVLNVFTKIFEKLFSDNYMDTLRNINYSVNINLDLDQNTPQRRHS